jgi:hypothetical protein
MGYQEKLISMNSSPDKKIWIYDDLFNYSDRARIYEMTVGSLYRIKGSDNSNLESKEHLSVVSTWTEQDLKNSKILDLIPLDIKKKHNLDRSVVGHVMINMVTPSDRFHIHTDNAEDSWTMLYYVNMDWHPEWGGDTLFLDETTNNIEHLCQFKPGRLVLFHPEIPHLIRPSTVLAPHYRFSLAVKFFSDPVVR